MNTHPGGEKHTRRMLALAPLTDGAKILDMGAGAGETVTILRTQGYEAVGIDLAPRGENVEKADFLCAPFPKESFDAVISQCAFFVSGNAGKALSEAYRVLKKGGILMLSDVFFRNAVEVAESVPFKVLHSEDLTAQWREYYLEALWRGAVCCGIRGRCTYEMLICKKE